MHTKLFIPLSLFFLVILGACSANKNDESIENEKARIENEKQRIELEKEKLEFEKQKLDNKDGEKENTSVSEEDHEDILDLAKKARNLEIQTEVVVTAEKAFFYSRADEGFRKKAYLQRGDQFTIMNKSNNYVYTEYYNPDFDKTTVGWIKISDIEPIR